MLAHTGQDMNLKLYYNIVSLRVHTFQYTLDYMTVTCSKQYKVYTIPIPYVETCSKIISLTHPTFNC